jgi:vacuolar-type H+-ATPase subunit H
MGDRPEEAIAAVEGPQASHGRTDIGEKVNAIIEAAEAAAAEIGEKARREARAIVNQADEQAAERIEALTREASEARAEADQYARDMREAADSYGTQHRRSAEEEALRVLSEAEEKARERLGAAEQKAEQMERDIGERHSTLKREARMLEERRHRVLESLRDLAAQIQDALVEPARETAPQEGEEALMDALDVERRR